MPHCPVFEDLDIKRRLERGLRSAGEDLKISTKESQLLQSDPSVTD